MVKKIFLLSMTAIYIATWFIYYEEMGANHHFHMLMWAIAIFGIYLYSFEKSPLPAFFWKRFIMIFSSWQVMYLIVYGYFARRYKIDADIGNNMINFMLIIPIVFLLYKYAYRFLEQKPVEEEIGSCRKIFCWAGFALLIFSMAAFDDINLIRNYVQDLPELLGFILNITMLVGLFCYAGGKKIIFLPPA